MIESGIEVNQGGNAVTKITTEQIITGYMVKYNNLSRLINLTFSDCKADVLNIYIDLYGVIKSIFSDHFRVNMKDYTAVTSTILNMCGHYRQFFKYNNVHTRIYIIFSYNDCHINRQFVYDYNSFYHNKYRHEDAKKMVELNIELLNLICPYLHDIFFLRTDFESGVLIDYLISKGDSNPNLIISRDFYPSQNTYLHPLTAQLIPKKYRGEDLSIIIPTNENPLYNDIFWSVYANSGFGSSRVNRHTITIDPVNMTLLSALNRYTERGLKTLLNIKIANKIIYDVVQNQRNKISTVSILDAVQEKGLSISEVDSRHKSLDIEFFRSIFWESPESKMIKLENLNDDGAVRAICSQYFTTTPVDLGRL